MACLKRSLMKSASLRIMRLLKTASAKIVAVRYTSWFTAWIAIALSASTLRLCPPLICCYHNTSHCARLARIARLTHLWTSVVDFTRDLASSVVLAPDSRLSKTTSSSLLRKEIPSSISSLRDSLTFEVGIYYNFALDPRCFYRTTSSGLVQQFYLFETRWLLK